MAVLRLEFTNQQVIETIATGRRAWESLKRYESWAWWVEVGLALDKARTEAMHILNLNQPTGQIWSREWGAWLQETGFGEIDKGVRSRLQRCIDELPAIGKWLECIGQTKRLTLNHPNAVWRGYQKALGVEKPSKAERKNDQIQELQQENDQLHTENAKQKRRIEELTTERQGFLEQIAWLEAEIARLKANGKTKAQTAWQADSEGREAKADGVSEDECPYDCDNEPNLYAAWRMGWGTA